MLSYKMIKCFYINVHMRQNIMHTAKIVLTEKCVVCEIILHEVSAQQCHTRPNVGCGAVGFSTSAVCPIPHTVIWGSFYAMVLIIINIHIS